VAAGSAFLKRNVVIRVTRFGEFSLIELLSSLGNFLKFSQLEQMFRHIFPRKSYVIIFVKTWLLAADWATFLSTASGHFGCHAEQ
jgi:hypothetical protein